MIPAISLVFTIFGEFCMCGRVYLFVVVVLFCFFTPTIEVVTFRLCGWCMLGVFLLPAFTRLGNECQELLGPCDGMHVYTDWTSLYALIRVLGNGVRTHVSYKAPPLPFYRSLRGGSKPRRCIAQDSEPNKLPTELFRPHKRVQYPVVQKSYAHAHHVLRSSERQGDEFSFLKERKKSG